MGIDQRLHSFLSPKGPRELETPVHLLASSSVLFSGVSQGREIVMCTGVPLTSESAGFKMTLSVGSRPLTISTLLP